MDGIQIINWITTSKIVGQNVWVITTLKASTDRSESMVNDFLNPKVYDDTPQGFETAWKRMYALLLEHGDFRLGKDELWFKFFLSNEVPEVYKSFDGVPQELYLIINNLAEWMDVLNKFSLILPVDKYPLYKITDEVTVWTDYAPIARLDKGTVVDS